MAENYRIMQSKREGEDFVRNSVAITGAAVWSDEVGGIQKYQKKSTILNQQHSKTLPPSVLPGGEDES